MKVSLTTLGISGVLLWFCCAQDSGPVGVTPRAPPNADQAAYYASLNQRVLEFKTQFDLLGRLAQEHQKRAEETPADQAARIQWEKELAKELSDRASAILALRNKVSKEREAFEQTHPDLVASGQPYLRSGGYNPDGIAFMEKLDERLAAVQQEIAETLATGKAYTAQLLTNTGADTLPRISLLLQENGYQVKKLEKEASDLELKKLEFRALRRD